MTADCFYKYVTTIFYPWLVKNKIEFPVILYMDGHSSHLTQKLSQFCREKKIELVALYPNATHILQPLDVPVFSPLKKIYKKTIDEWRIENATQRLTRETFAPVLKKTIDALPHSETTIRNGFKTCGLFPFSPDQVDFNILNKKKKYNEATDAAAEMEKGVNEHNLLESKKHLQFFEDNLEPATLQDFKNAIENSTDISNSDNIGLFNYWKNLRRRSG